MSGGFSVSSAGGIGEAAAAIAGNWPRAIAEGSSVITHIHRGIKEYPASISERVFQGTLKIIS
ncbi:hypothetical protein [Thermoleptolyngbya sp.]